jgi:capsular polysaccharide export protein
LKFQQAKTGWIYRGVLQHPLLPAFLHHNIRESDRIHVGWGYGASSRAACRAAERSGNRALLIEDAFVRSIHPGCGKTVYGILADTGGLPSHSNGRADLINALDSGSPTGWMRTGSTEKNAVLELMERFKHIGVSKFNWFPDEFRGQQQPSKQGFLLDFHEPGFGQALKSAFELTTNDPIYLLATSKDVSRINIGSGARDLLKDSRIQLLSRNLSPTQYFSYCHTVIVDKSLMGMEALIHEKKVITFGSPFFAGRGLTQDHSTTDNCRRHVDLLELFRTAYLQYCHYFDPDTEEPCGLAVILDHIELQKEMFRKNSGHSVTVDFSPWKRKVVPDYLRSPSGHLSQVKCISDVPKNCRVLVWSRKQEIPENLLNQTIWVEDGFIRSKGLGAAFNFPYSWVLDETGIYFDSSGPSDLEILYNKGFDASDLAKSKELIDVLREKRMTKYNLAASPIAFDRKQTNGRKIILVPGQVDADASILFGSPIVKSNLELLGAVRKAEPDAFIIFKAHPDLVANTRHGQIRTDGIDALADLVVTDGNVLDWLERCDVVHTMTSTVGFEALIRNVPVVTYGLPFYAGWGLTTDHLTCDRRQRQLTLEELVCGALMKYPRYLNPVTGEFTTALKVIKLLSSDSPRCNRLTWYLRAILCMKRARVKAARK